MANNLNICTFSGTLVRDPETRQAGQRSVTNFSIAINKGPRDKQTVIYMNCAAWEKLGGIVEEYAHKGDKIIVSGELTHRKYQDKNGVEKDQWGLTANTVELLGGNRSNARQTKTQTTHEPMTGPDLDESIPF